MPEKIQKNFQKKNKNPNSLFHKIEVACKDLFYVSETDAPVLAFAGSAAEDVTREIILQQTGGRADDPLEEVSLRDFFGRLTAIKDWFGERERLRAKKFLDLQKLIEENLSDPKVFKIGKIRVQIYAVGLDNDGILMGITTNAVET